MGHVSSQVTHFTLHARKHVYSLPISNHSNTNSEDHPVFKEELARIEEDRVKKLGQAKHMLDLGCSNEEATLDIEKRAADNTLEVCATFLV